MEDCCKLQVARSCKLQGACTSLRVPWYNISNYSPPLCLSFQVQACGSPAGHPHLLTRRQIDQWSNQCRHLQILPLPLAAVRFFSILCLEARQVGIIDRRAPHHARSSQQERKQHQQEERRRGPPNSRHLCLAQAKNLHRYSCPTHV